MVYRRGRVEQKILPLKRLYNICSRFFNFKYVKSRAMRTKVSTYDVIAIMGKRRDRRCGAVKSLANRLTSARALVSRLHENCDSADDSQKINKNFFKQ